MEFAKRQRTHSLFERRRINDARSSIQAANCGGTTAKLNDVVGKPLENL